MIGPIETDKVVLAVTPLGLFSNQSRYVFGVSLIGGNRGIMSYCRFTATRWTPLRTVRSCENGL